MGKTFFNQIKDAKEERDIELVYKNNLTHSFKNSIISYPFKCDGYLEEEMMYDEKTKLLRLIMEFKYGWNFNDLEDRAKVLLQVIFYLKRFQIKINKHYMDMPNIILAGDKTTCFIISTNEVDKYLYEEINWNIAPSEAANIYKDLVEKISNDDKLNPIIFNINKNFKFDYLVKDIKRLIIDIKIKFQITEANLSAVYDYFIERIVRDPTKCSASDLVQCFIDTIIGEVEISEKKGIKYIAKDSKRIEIDVYNYQKFEEECTTKYSIEEKNKFIAIKDRLIEDTKRRFNGEFYTPTIWVNEVNKQLDIVLGDYWREEYVVWDCSWGTGNLTRDYYFDNLFCSTLEIEDIRLGENYNANSCKFQYDFLNDDIELISETEYINLKMPISLYNAFKENKKILMFINPPFGENSNGKQKNKKFKKGMSKNKVKALMDKENLAYASQQIYNQFLYRILKMKQVFKLTNLVIGIFTPTLFLSGERAEKFRNIFLKEFKYEKGIMFNAKYFSNVSSEWAVGFTIWKSGKNINNNKFIFEVKELMNNRRIETINNKIVYNVEKNNKLSQWIKNTSSGTKEEKVLLTSSLEIDTKTKNINEQAIGFLMNDSNNVYANAQGVYILSTPVSRHIKTTVINKENYRKCFSLFAARSLVKSNWEIQKDGYMIPNINNELYEEWEKDAIIYALFKSGTSSLRNIEFEDKKYNIYNEMFFMSNKKILELANAYGNEKIYWDCKASKSERQMYVILESESLSKEGEYVLVKAKNLIEKSFKYRNEFDEKYPNYNINTWDAGWYQIKKLLEVYMNDELKEFYSFFKKLEEKMFPLVYELGFLKR